MHKRLQHNFNLLEQDRKLLMDNLLNFNEEELQRKPKNGKWSIVHTITHLVTSERLSLLYMKKKSLGVNQLADSGLVENLKMIVLKLSQRLPFLKFTAPKAVVDHTPTDLTFAELARQWESTRQSLKEFLQSIEEKNVRKKIYKHPVVGQLDVVQGVAFSREHFMHHLPQLKKLMRETKQK